MAFLKETKNTLKVFFVFVGILYLLSMNMISIVLGLLYIYFGIFLEKLIPSKTKLIVGVLWVSLAVGIIFNMLAIASAGFRIERVVALALILLFNIYLIRSVQRISSEQSSPKDASGETAVEDNKNDHTIRNIIILIVALAIIGFVFVSFINKL